MDEKFLTPEQVKTHVETGDGQCPHCGSYETEWLDYPDVDGIYLYAGSRCLHCKEKWVDIYQLIRVAG